MRSLTIRVYLIALFLHLLLIVATSVRDLSGLLAEGGNIFSDSLQPVWKKSGSFCSAALGGALARFHPVRQIETIYTRCAGIDSGYSFFAPNVPNSYKLAFEIKHSDKTSEIVLPEVGDVAAGLRLTTLLEYLGQVPSEPLRRRVLEKLAYIAWASHSDATRIRAIFAAVLVPDLQNFQRDSTESYQVICVYDFYPQANKLRP